MTRRKITIEEITKPGKPFEGPIGSKLTKLAKSMKWPTFTHIPQIEKSSEVRRIKKEIHSHLKGLVKHSQADDLMFIAWLIDKFNVGELAAIINMDVPRDEVFKDFMDAVYSPEVGRDRDEGRTRE